MVLTWIGRLEQAEMRSLKMGRSPTSEIPGFNSFGESLPERLRQRHPSLRGRPVRIFVDGVPVAADDELLSVLNPDSVERIEVIPGPSILCSAF